MMQCRSCGTTGEGAYCAQCGARLGVAPDPEASDAFWADDSPTGAWTTATRVPSESPWRPDEPEPSLDDWQAHQGPIPVDPAAPDVPEMLGGGAFPDYPWAPRPPEAPAVPPEPYAGGQPPYAAAPYAAGPVPPSSPTPPSGTPWPLAVGAALAVGLLVLAIGGGALWFFTADDEDPAVAVTDTSSTSTSTSPSTSSDPTTTTVTSTTTSTTSSSASAVDQLGDLREDSLARLSTDDRWAVSLSAKQDGTRDDRQVTSSGSHVFRLPDILELHEGFEAMYSSSASVYLLKAEDLGSTKGPDEDRIWMSIVDPGGLASRDDAEQWCAAEFSWLSGDDLENACYPRQLRSP